MAPVRSAPRPRKRGSFQAEVLETAQEAALNAAATLREVVEDFRSSDRFFKYKALVLAVWAALSASTFIVACPPGPDNSIEATLVEADGIFLVKNDSSTGWRDVELEVNHRYRGVMAFIEANGGAVTLTPAVLYDADGQRAPADLRVTDIVVRVYEPEATVVLLKGGQRPR